MMTLRHLIQHEINKSLDLFNHYGIASKPTQFFWGRLQELTEALHCVQIQK